MDSFYNLYRNPLPKEWAVWVDFRFHHGYSEKKVPLQYVTKGGWIRRVTQHGGNYITYAMSPKQQQEFVKDHQSQIHECSHVGCPCHDLEWEKPYVKVFMPTKKGGFDMYVRPESAERYQTKHTEVIQEETSFDDLDDLDIEEVPASAIQHKIIKNRKATISFELECGHTLDVSESRREDILEYYDAYSINCPFCSL